MRTDDAREPESDPGPGSDPGPAGGADSEYQDTDDALACSDGIRLVRAALSVLEADIDRGEPDGIEDAAIRDMRVSAAQRLTRLMCSDIDAG